MKIVVVSFGIVVLLFGAVFIFSGSSDKTDKTTKQDKPETVSSLQDAHGLAVDRRDSSKVYIATHTGLLAFRNDATLERVSDAKDDYMGFSAHPTDANKFYSSGHPSTGGNIGFQKSTDGGKTWLKLSNGIGGPVDFHTMAVSQAEPNIIYGVYRGQLQRSSDEGKNWELVNAANIGNIITLATDAINKDMVYAGTTSGLYASQNRGSDWSKVSSIDGAVTSLAVTSSDGKSVIAFTDKQGLMKSTDAGSTWTNLKGYAGNTVLQIALDRQTPSTLYLINQSLEIYKTIDGGDTWNKVR